MKLAQPCGYLVEHAGVDGVEREKAPPRAGDVFDPVGSKVKAAVQSDEAAEAGLEPSRQRRRRGGGFDGAVAAIHIAVHAALGEVEPVVMGNDLVDVAVGQAGRTIGESGGDSGVGVGDLLELRSQILVEEVGG